MIDSHQRPLISHSANKSVSFSFDISSSAPSHDLSQTQPRPSVGIRSEAAVYGYTYSVTPPLASYLLESIASVGIPDKIYREPRYYSNYVDAPEHPREYAGLHFDLTKGGSESASLPKWGNTSLEKNRPKPTLSAFEVTGWEYASVPPSVRLVREWATSNKFQPQAKSKRVGVGVGSQVRFRRFKARSRP